MSPIGERWGRLTAPRVERRWERMGPTAARVTEHARWEMGRREVAESAVLAVVDAPEQVVPIRLGREVRQSRVACPPDGKVYVLRAIVDVAAEEVTVVTVYRTSKIEKYWRVP